MAGFLQIKGLIGAKENSGWAKSGENSRLSH